MRILPLITKLLVISSATIFSSAGIASPADDAAEIHDSIQKLESMLVDSYAHGISGSEHVFYGKLFDQPRDDAAVIFSIEGFSGGNTLRQYLAVFAKMDLANTAQQQKKFQLIDVRQIGGTGWRVLTRENARVTSHRIELTGAECERLTAQCPKSKDMKFLFDVAFDEVGKFTITESNAQ